MTAPDLKLVTRTPAVTGYVEIDPHRNAPRPDPACLYGLVGEIAHAGADGTEANIYAVAAAAIAYLSCAVGRGPFMQVGNVWHHARQYLLHVGRSGEGRKGTALSIIRRIDRRLREISSNATNSESPFAPQIHDGGLSSREGLAMLIHDGYSEGKTEVPAIEDKRLLVIEEEFANVLQQAKRDGNTLSAALRTAWDGGPIKPATKTNRVWASHPHICLLAAITPSELKALITQRELTNGFLNRFLVYWAERPALVALPRGASNATVDTIAHKVLDVLRFCHADAWVDRDSLRISLSPDAEQYYAGVYRGVLNDRSCGERVAAMVERRAPTLLRLAMLFAVTDKTVIVEKQHLEAALAWVRYGLESIKYVFASAADEAAAAQAEEVAHRILRFIAGHGPATRNELVHECFGGHLSKNRIDGGLDRLLTATPPLIVISENPINGAARATKTYAIAPNVAKSRKRRNGENSPQSPENTEKSQMSQTSHRGVEEI